MPANWFPAYEVEAYASAARTATPTAVEIANTYNHPRAYVFINATAASDTPSVVFNISTECNGSSAYFEVIDSAAVTGISKTAMGLGMGAEVSDLATVFPPGRRIQIAPVHADADSITYSVYVLFTN